MVTDYREHAKALPDDALENFFGKELVDRLRKSAVRKIKTAQANPALSAPGRAPSTGKTTPVAPKEAEKVSYKKFFKPW